MVSKSKTVHELKNVKLVLGNGFDLHCGLKTSYSNYFESNDSKNKVIDDCLVAYGIRADAENYVRQNTYRNDFCTKLTNEGCNLWDLYFYLASVGEDRKSKNWGWCDIESEIEQSLHAFSVSSSQKYIWDIVYKTIKFQRLPFDENSMSDNYYILAAFALSECNRKPFVSESEFYVFLLNELKRFEKNFGKYVNNQRNLSMPSKANKSLSSFAANSKKTINDLCNIKRLKSIDTFNYDAPVLPRTNQIVTIHNVNGTIEWPIFGIDSDIFKSSDPQYIFSKTNRRMELDMSTSRTDKDVPFENVVIFGHSLDGADYSYFFSILDRMEITNFEKSSTIVFAYSIYDGDKEYLIKSNLRKSISKLFEAYSDYRGNGKQLNRLLDTLTTQGKVLMYEIPTIPTTTN